MVALGEVMSEDFEPRYQRTGDTHAYTFDALGYELRLNRVRVGADTVHAWLSVRSRNPGEPEKLLSGDVNLTGPQARSSLAKQLDERCLTQTDWKRVLEVAFVDLIETLGEGSPTYIASAIPPRVQSRFRIEPLAFEKLPVIWFGRGGAGKSLVALAAAISLQADVALLPLPLAPGPVLYCDWELDRDTWGEELRLLCAGMGIDTPGVHYRQCLTPLHHEAEAIGRYIDQEGIEVVFIDSLGAACGADKNSQEVATRMMNAIRSWGVTAICLDHIAKSENTATPYGSAYFETAARATWRFKGVAQDNDHFVRIAIEKSNLGRYDDVNLKFSFEPSMKSPSAINCEVVSARDIPDEARSEQTSHGMLIRTALLDARRALTIGELVEMTGVKDRVLRARVADLIKRGEMVMIPIKGFANKYALRSARETMEAMDAVGS